MLAGIAVHKVMDLAVLTIRHQRIMNTLETRETASFAVQWAMDPAVLITPRTTIGMEVVPTCVDGVVLLPSVPSVLLAHQRLIRDEFKDINY
jgi:hypothetical protein